MRKALAAAIITGGLALAPALDVVHAQDDAATEDDDDGDNTGLWGLLGLLGLAGLAGLKRRDVRVDTTRRTTVADPGIR